MQYPGFIVLKKPGIKVKTVSQKKIQTNGSIHNRKCKKLLKILEDTMYSTAEFFVNISLLVLVWEWTYYQLRYC